MSYTQITDTHDNILKGEKYYSKMMDFNPCIFSCTMPVKCRRELLYLLEDTPNQGFLS